MEHDDSGLEGEFSRALTRYSPGIVIGDEVMPPGEIYRMIDEFDSALIAEGVAVEVVETWGYAFPTGDGGGVTTGLSVRGVESAIREMMKHGEIIQTDEPKVTYEDKDEIRLVCTARRFILRPDTGEMVEVDHATRALRQEKFQMVNVMEPTGESWPSGQPKLRVKRDDRGKPVKERADDPKWYEKAYAKAARNAGFPLIRPDVKSQMISAFKATERYQQLTSGRGGGGAALPAGEPQQNRGQQQRNSRPRGAQGTQGARSASPATTDTRETPSAPSAPSQGPTGAISADDLTRAGRILTDIRQSQGPERHAIVYNDLIERFPEAVVAGGKGPILGNIKGLTAERGRELVRRLELHQAGEDPDNPGLGEGPGAEATEGEYREVVADEGFEAPA